MRNSDAHLTEQSLLSAIDGELPPQEAECIRAHLAGCWTCRTRMREMEEKIGDFIRAREAMTPRLPPADGPRALLKARLAQMTSSMPSSAWERISTGLLRWRMATVVLSSGLVALVVMGWFRVGQLDPEGEPHGIRFSDASVPDPRITPGAVLPLTKDDVCAAGIVEATRVVPVEVARQVFAAYRIERPEPRAYEMDYLITPALGGSDHIRNFWPQPYKDTMWNAHIKDALEDHLRRMVCQGEVELARAQQEIAQNWIATYKKYFRTETPLAEHATFLKDRPWE